MNPHLFSVPLQLFYLIVIIFFFLAYFLFLAGLIRSRKSVRTRKANSPQGNFSIIIAARNEEKKIPDLLKSLQKLDYPAENFEILICDDGSTDKTREIVKSFLPSFTNLQLVDHNPGEPHGKRNALEKGIAKSKFDRILITDADCVVQPGWLKETDRYFTGDTQFLIGIAPLIRDHGFFNALSCFENLRSFLLISASFGWGHPVSATARNMGFLKSVFHNEGGYESTRRSLGGDDDLLLKNFLDKGYKINFCPSTAAAVFSSTNHQPKAYLRQKARHTAASKFYSNLSKWILVFWHLPNLYAQSSVLLLPWFPEVVYTFLIKISLDTILVLALQKKLNYNFSLPAIIFYQIFYEIFLIINYFASRFTKFNWK